MNGRSRARIDSPPSGVAATFDDELLLTLGDESASDRAADADEFVRSRRSSHSASRLAGVGSRGERVRLGPHAACSPHTTLIREVARRSGGSGSRSSPAAGRDSWRPPTAAADGGRAFGRLQHRASAEQQENGYLDIAPALPPLLRAQGDVRALRQRVRDRPRGFGTLDETVRGADADPDRHDRHFPVICVGDGSGTGCSTGSGPARSPTVGSIRQIWPGSTSPPIPPRSPGSCSRRTSDSFARSRGESVRRRRLKIRGPLPINGLRSPSTPTHTSRGHPVNERVHPARHHRHRLRPGRADHRPRTAARGLARVAGPDRPGEDPAGAGIQRSAAARSDDA